MPGPLEILQITAARLDAAGIDYCLVGSLAAMYYGTPRFTNDINLFLEIKPKQLAVFQKTFDTEEFYCPPFEVLRDEVVRMGSFNLIHQNSGIKIDIILLKNTEFYTTEFSRRQKVTLTKDFEGFIASPEDIIVKKLDFYREGGSEKHLDDIRNMLTTTQVDQRYLDRWIAHFGLQKEWKKIES